MTQAKITILSENSVRRRGMLAEHGLSLLIQTPSTQILFDTGQGLVLSNNMKVCGVDVQQIDVVGLSHGHYDHSGGLGALIQQKQELPVFAHPEVFQRRWSRAGDGKVRENGSPDGLQEKIRNFQPVDRMLEIADGIWMTGPVPRTTAFEDTGGDFFLDAICQQKDEIVDDQALFFETSKGIVVLAGCAHSGIVNILEFVRAVREGIPLRAVVGGFHLEKATGDRTSRTVQYLKESCVDEIFPMHCVGRRAWQALREGLGGRCREARAGSTLEFR